MVTEQVTAFAFTIGIGLLAGFVYDFYQALRRVFRWKRTGTFLGDLLFFLILTVFVFGLLMLVNYGEMRFYVILGMAMGAFIYFKLISKLGSKVILLFFRFLQKTFRLGRDFLNYFWRIATFPFRILFLAVWWPVVFAANSFYSVQNWAKKPVVLALNNLKRLFKKP